MTNGSTSETGERKVVIDAFPSAALRYARGWAVVAVDVFRATTTAVTAVASGRRCFPAATVDDAAVIAAGLDHPLLAGEVGGNMPFGYELNNSPADMALRTDVHRPAVLVSSSGTLLMNNAARSGHAYVACLRNVTATVRSLAQRYGRVAVIGAGSRGEFREEDQMCCVQIAEGLMARGFLPGNDETSELVRHWTEVPTDAWLESNSVEYLLSTGQEQDLEFVLGHVDDLGQAFRMKEGEVVAWDDSTDGRERPFHLTTVGGTIRSPDPGTESE